jgi:DeoR/GlpR family transcriptional regulator of sugar metabolism
MNYPVAKRRDCKEVMYINRRKKILDSFMLYKEGSVAANKLAGQDDAGEVTIRRDLKYLIL